MHRMMVQSLLALILAGCVTTSLAGNPAIGLAMARGSFRVDNSQVWGNTTLFEGALVETSRASLELHLNSGAKAGLAPESRGKVYGDRLVLERGRGELKAASSYGIEARSLRIVAAEREATARVAFDKENRVLVAAVKGPVRVSTKEGLVVANIDPGRTLVFDPQPQVPGAAPPAKVTGRLERKNGHYLLTDETSKVTFEVIGPGLEQEVGNRIEVTGVIDPSAKPFALATQVVKITKLTRLPAVPPPGGWAGLSAGAKGAIIAGIAVGATVGILAATDVIFEEKKPISP